MVALQPEIYNTIVNRDADAYERARLCVEQAEALTVQALPPPAALADGHARLNEATLAVLFLACSGLEEAVAAAQEQLKQFASWLEENDVADSREERTFR